MNDMDANMEPTPELASRVAVVAVTVDAEFWARTFSVDGRVGLNDLTRTIEVIRLAAAPGSDAYDSAGRIGRPEVDVDLR